MNNYFNLKFNDNYYISDSFNLFFDKNFPHLILFEINQTINQNFILLRIFNYVISKQLQLLTYYSFFFFFISIS